jgi:hypothetical protein
VSWFHRNKLQFKTISVKNWQPCFVKCIDLIIIGKPKIFEENSIGMKSSFSAIGPLSSQLHQKSMKVNTNVLPIIP